MIKNERQYRITKAQAEAFEAALAAVAEAAVYDAADENAADLRRLNLAATRGQLQTLRDEIAEYEALVSGERQVLTADSFADLPRLLIAARIATGLSQKDFAARLDLKEQQVQRYEATDYATASLATLGRVVDALGVQVRKDMLLPKADVSMRTLWTRLLGAGLSKDLVLSKLLPVRLSAEAEDAENDTAGEPAQTLAVRVAAALGRVFGVGAADFFGPGPLRLAGAAGTIARYKVSASANATRLGAYTTYAHHLALLALRAVPESRSRALPETVDEFRRAALRSGGLTFSSLLRFAWDCGIVVLPLSDSGAFHGACWRASGRHVVVLKQRNQSPARWAFDLLHEMRHTLQEDQDPEFSVVEAEENSEERRTSPWEKDADHFAANVLLAGRAGTLAEECQNRARGAVERLKAVVPLVARDAGVDVGALANYMAFRMSRENIADWWGAASNLQSLDGATPWLLCRDVFLERADFGRIDALDRELLVRALEEFQ